MKNINKLMQSILAVLLTITLTTTNFINISAEEVVSCGDKKDYSNRKIKDLKVGEQCKFELQSNYFVQQVNGKYQWTGSDYIEIVKGESNFAIIKAKKATTAQGIASAISFKASQYGVYYRTYDYTAFIQNSVEYSLVGDLPVEENRVTIPSTVYKHTNEQYTIENQTVAPVETVNSTNNRPALATFNGWTPNGTITVVEDTKITGSYSFAYDVESLSIEDKNNVEDKDVKLDPTKNINFSANITTRDNNNAFKNIKWTVLFNDVEANPNQVSYMMGPNGDNTDLQLTVKQAGKITVKLTSLHDSTQEDIITFNAISDEAGELVITDNTKVSNDDLSETDLSYINDNNGTIKVETVIDYSEEYIKDVYEIAEKENFTEDIELATFADVSIVKTYYDKFGNVDANKEAENIISTSQMQDVTMEVMATLSEVEEGYHRVFTAYNYHNGEVIKINNVKYNKEANTVSFKANKFSTYLVVYKDVKNITNNSSCGLKNDKNCDGVVTCEELRGQGWIWNNTTKACVFTNKYYIVNTDTK